MMKKISLSIFYLALIGFAALSAAHRFFFGITDLSLNHHSHHLEIIHQLSAHDIENLIADQQNIRFSSEHPQYEHYIQQYVEQHFFVKNQHKIIPLHWVGYEYNEDLIIVYQESDPIEKLIGLTINNDLLVDQYPQQVNTVNVQFKQKTQSLTFNRSKRVDTITANN